MMLRSRRPVIHIHLTQRHIFKSFCNGRILMSHGQLMIGPWFSSLMSQGFVWTSRTDGLGFGEVKMNA
jgi:hypothetical protein